jgi:hypothetical protein
MMMRREVIDDDIVGWCRLCIIYHSPTLPPFINRSHERGKESMGYKNITFLFLRLTFGFLRSVR